MALDEFLKDYILVFSSRYSEFLKEQLDIAAEIISDKEMSLLEMRISSSTIAYKEAQKSIYEQFMREVYGDVSLSELNIKSPIVRESIKNMAINAFNERIEKTLAQTNTDILAVIRDFQRDLIQTEHKKNMIKYISDIKTDEIEAMKEKLNKELFDRNKDFFSMKDDGQFVRYSDGKLVPFETYEEMATRTTTLNVQRDAVQINEAMNERRISEYVLLDNRPLKVDKKGRTHPREICKEIMATKYYGVSLIAHDKNAADLYGIYTIDEAKELGAMGPNCRHGIASLPDDIYAHIDNTLYFAENEVV